MPIGTLPEGRGVYEVCTQVLRECMCRAVCTLGRGLVRCLVGGGAAAANNRKNKKRG